MKFLLTISFSLLVFSIPTLCLPGQYVSHTYPYGKQQNELQMKEFGHAERVKQQDMPKDAIEELDKQIAGVADYLHLQANPNGRVLEQGSGVALKLLTGYHLWFSCWYYQNCHTDPCPGHEFDDSERIPCRGEAFKMYRALGPGEIRTGDFVGLYYPEEGNWFAVTNGVGQKSSCPGAPTMNDGFSSYGKWVECGDSAFQVYAKGKVTGEKITDKDILAFYHPGLTEKTYVEFLSNSIGTSTCLRDAANNIRPPPSSAYDNCVDNTVQLTIYV